MLREATTVLPLVYLRIILPVSYVYLISIEEEISAMKSALEKYGISLPSFGKIGGILANEVISFL